MAHGPLVLYQTEDIWPHIAILFKSYVRYLEVHTCNVLIRNGDTNSSQEAVGPLTDSLYKQVINLLQLVKTSSSRMSEAAALFMDELANVVGQGHLDSKVEVDTIQIPVDTKSPEFTNLKLLADKYSVY